MSYIFHRASPVHSYLIQPFQPNLTEVLPNNRLNVTKGSNSVKTLGDCRLEVMLEGLGAGGQSGHDARQHVHSRPFKEKKTPEYLIQ